jgi:hypothetical protein
VVVDHQHAQAPVASAAGAAAARRLGFTSGTPKGHRQSHSPHARLALAELDDPAGLDGLERASRRPIPLAGRGRPWMPSLQISITNVSSIRSTVTSTEVGSACLLALRTASIRHRLRERLDLVRHPQRRVQRQARAPGCTSASRPNSSANVVCVGRAIRPSGRRARSSGPSARR